MTNNTHMVVPHTQELCECFKNICNKQGSQAHFKEGSVAVHEYANSTSAHDTVLEHRFSPTRTPFTSWQYANERGQG